MVSYEGGRYTINANYDIHQDPEALTLLAPYKKTVDSLMSPVIGHSDHLLTVKRPESELFNLTADILRFTTADYIGRVADIGIMNMGGLRSSLPAGDLITERLALAFSQNLLPKKRKKLKDDFYGRNLKNRFGQNIFGRDRRGDFRQWNTQ